MDDLGVGGLGDIFPDPDGSISNSRESLTKYLPFAPNLGRMVASCRDQKPASGTSDNKSHRENVSKNPQYDVEFVLFRNVGESMEQEGDDAPINSPRGRATKLVAGVSAEMKEAQKKHPTISSKPRAAARRTTTAGTIKVTEATVDRIVDKPRSQMTLAEKRAYDRIKKQESRKRLELDPVKRELHRQSERSRSKEKYKRLSSTPEGRQRHNGQSQASMARSRARRRIATVARPSPSPR